MNMNAGAVEVFSLIDPTNASHQRMNFCAALARTHFSASETLPGASKPNALALLLRVKPSYILVGSASAGVSIPHDSRSFYVHPAAGEAALQLASVHTGSSDRAALRVAAKIEAAKLSNLNSSGLNTAPWVLGRPMQGGKLNEYRLLADGSASTACLEGVETRRLVTERPPTQQPRQARHKHQFHPKFTVNDTSFDLRYNTNEGPAHFLNLFFSVATLQDTSLSQWNGVDASQSAHPNLPLWSRQCK